MPSDDRPINLAEFYAPDIAKCQAYMDASGYQLTFDALHEKLESGDLEGFEGLLAYRYYQIICAVFRGEPDCDYQAVDAHRRFINRLRSGELSWNAIDFHTNPLHLEDL